jgi:hypothetical protein
MRTVRRRSGCQFLCIGRLREDTFGIHGECCHASKQKASNRIKTVSNRYQSSQKMSPYLSSIEMSSRLDLNGVALERSRKAQRRRTQRRGNDRLPQHLSPLFSHALFVPMSVRMLSAGLPPRSRLGHVDGLLLLGLAATLQNGK